MSEQRSGTSIDGWFSRVYPDGLIVSGHGTVFAGERAIGEGIAPQLFSERLLVKGADDRPYMLPISGGERVLLADVPARQFAAGGGVWMAATGDVIWAAVSREGQRAWAVEHGGNDDREIVVDGVAVARGPVDWPRIEGGAVCWTQFGGERRLQVMGRLPGGATEVLRLSRESEIRGVPIPTPFGFWILTQTNTEIRLAPWGDRHGVVVLTGEDQNMHPDACWLDDGRGILVVWNTAAGERRQRLVTMQELRVDLLAGQPEPIPDPDPIPDPEPEPHPMTARLTEQQEAYLRRRWEEELGPLENGIRVRWKNAFDGHQVAAETSDALFKIAAEMHKTDKRIGLYPKTSGTNHRGRGEDILLIRENGQVFWKDVVGSISTRNPVLNLGDFALSTEPDKWVEPFPVGDVEPPPVEPPPPSSDLQKQIEALMLRQTAVEKDIAELKRRPPAADINGKRIALMADNGKYVSADHNLGDALVADRSDIQGWETFTIAEVK